jgi:hypothetical protein
MNHYGLYKPEYDSSYALVVGINKYKKVGPLAYAVNDVTEIVRILVEKLQRALHLSSRPWDIAGVQFIADPPWRKPDSNRWSPPRERTDSPPIIEMVPRPARPTRKRRWDY